jgi:heme-degrading monooxygenase HmoA
MAQTTQQNEGGGTMPYVMVTHKVADYTRWKPIFDADGANREIAGSQGGQLFRSADDPNEVAILFEWDLEQARQYSQREEVRAKMQEAGVLAPPELSFLEEIEQLSR